jgi:hypothetical protein
MLGDKLDGWTNNIAYNVAERIANNIAFKGPLEKPHHTPDNVSYDNTVKQPLAESHILPPGRVGRYQGQRGLQINI